MRIAPGRKRVAIFSAPAAENSGPIRRIVDQCALAGASRCSEAMAAPRMGAFDYCRNQPSKTTLFSGVREENGNQPIFER